MYLKTCMEIPVAVGEKVYRNTYNLYIYIKPKLLKLPQFSTSSLLKKKNWKKIANENRG